MKSLIFLSVCSTLVLGNPVSIRSPGNKEQVVPYIKPSGDVVKNAPAVMFNESATDMGEGGSNYDAKYITDIVLELLPALLDAGDKGNAVAVSDKTHKPEPTPAPSEGKKNVKARAVVCTTRIFNGPSLTGPDTPAAFRTNTDLAASASAAPIAPGYALVPNYVALNMRATVLVPQYLGYTKIGLTSYDPAVCATKCNKLAGCYSFNIFYERNIQVVDPDTQKPDPVSCPGTGKSPSGTYIKCAFFGIPILASNALFKGLSYGTFRMAISGSNSYVKSPAPTLDGYQGPVSFGNAAIAIPSDPVYGIAKNGYIGAFSFPPDSLYNPDLCASTCAAITAWYLAHPGNTRWGSPRQGCNFINTYMVWMNGIDGVFTCAFYSSSWGPAYATNVGRVTSSGKHITISNSEGYYLNGHYVD